MPATPEYHRAPPFATEIAEPISERPHWLVTLAGRIDLVVGMICRLTVLAIAVALTIVLTAGVIGCYITASGGMAAS